jgi:L-ascorbate metabolism protein UlaG (beta-lactamase superfamily)
MIITYYGNQFFKIAQGDTVIAINPPSKDGKNGKDAARFGSVLAVSTTNHPDYNGFDRVTLGAAVPFCVSGPGEYEHSGVVVQGKGTTTTLDGQEYNTAVYSLIFEDTKLGFAGPIDKQLLAGEMEVLNNCDILFVPIGGEGVLTPALANKLAVATEAKIIIPMDYGDGRLPDALKTFLKESGEEKVEPLDKLTIRRKEIEAKEGEVIVLAVN